MSVIRFEREGAVGGLVLSNPPHNRIGTEFNAGLRQAVHEAGKSDIRVLVVQGEGPDFSLGGDRAEWAARSETWFRSFTSEVSASFRALEAMPVPVMASVRGGAKGGGFELALSCDLIVASASAVFQCVEVNAGLVPIAGGVQRITEITGRYQAKRIVMLGQPVDAAEAARLNLVSLVVPDEELDAKTAELAAQLASGPTRAYAAAKSLVRAWSAGGVTGADDLLQDLVRGLYTSGHASRAIAAAANEHSQGHPAADPLSSHPEPTPT